MSGDRKAVGFTLRPAKPGDEATVLTFVKQLADYEKLAHEVTDRKSTSQNSIHSVN